MSDFTLIRTILFWKLQTKKKTLHFICISPPLLANLPHGPCCSERCVNDTLLAVKHSHKLPLVAPMAQFELLTFCSRCFIGFLILGWEVWVFTPAVKVLLWAFTSTLELNCCSVSWKQLNRFTVSWKRASARGIDSRISWQHVALKHKFNSPQPLRHLSAAQVSSASTERVISALHR